MSDRLTGPDLKAWRLSWKMTMQEAADLVRVSASTWHRWENSVVVPHDYMLRLALTALGK